ncbi:MAG: PQQ-binding-like beta-propeller repeat protein [Tannerellaceae bacterium]|jgi:outer membrane protein assembly factor BamB|nr:PQQ-binding-like beta-propeller repeat protein [Tannerellaceae bacterium]
MRGIYNLQFVIYSLCACACLFLACSGGTDRSVSGNRDWKLFRGNAALSGYTDTDLPRKPVLLWTYRGEAMTSSSPVIDNGTTYWSDKRGRIRGIDMAGQPVFLYDLQTAVEATPMISDSTLYIGRIDGFLTALSLAKRDTLWNFETMGQISASPNVMNFAGRKAIVFGSYDNYLYCVDAETGRELNRFESGYYLNGAAAVRKEYAAYGGCDAYVRIIDCRTGLPTDSLLLDAYVPASPAIAGDYCYVGDYSGNIYALLLEEGKIVRHEKIVSAAADNGSFVSVPAVSREAIYFFSGNRHLSAVSRKDGKLLWKYLLKGNVKESAPVVCRDKVIVCTGSGIVSILNADSGELLWEYDTGEQIIASPAIIKDHFMILTAKGRLFCFGEKAD